MVSAARAVGADPDTNPRLAQLVARLGEPLYLHVAPDGYPEKQDAWVNSGALLDRMNAAVALAAGNVPGLVVHLDSIVSPTADADRLVAALDERILGGTLSPNTRKVLRGGSFVTSARIARPGYRNFFTPERNDVIAGFRTCAV